jgi:hypothetical protein
MKELIRKILREEVGMKSTDKEFDEIKDSWFYRLRNYTLGDIVDNWDSLKNNENDNIQTIKYFVENPDKITDLIYDEKGLEDGYHRLIAAKILGIPKFKYIKGETITESRVKKSDRIDIYRDKNVIVVAPLTHEALKKYASECAWCINSDKYEWTHYHQGKIVVIIQRKPKNNKIGKTEQETPEEIYDFTHNGTRNEEEDDYFDELISSVSNFDTNIVYYNPEDEIIYDKGDNCMNDFGYSIYDIPHITEDIIKKIKSTLMN